MKNRVSFLSYHSTNASYSSPFTCCSYQKDRRTKPGNLPNKQSSFRNRRTLDRNLFLLLLFFVLKVWSLEGMLSRSLQSTRIASQPSCGGPIKLPTLLEMGYPTRGRQAVCDPPVHFIRPRLWFYCNYCMIKSSLLQGIEYRFSVVMVATSTEMSGARNCMFWFCTCTRIYSRILQVNGITCSCNVCVV
jgi:hypothetical protein